MIHIFDVDKTIVRKTSAEYFILEALKEKIIKISQIRRLPLDLISYKLARPDMDFIEKTVDKLAGIKKTDLERIAQASFEKRMNANIYTEADTLIKELVKNESRVVFATSSIDFIIQPLEIYFGIEASVATKMEYENGITTGGLNGYSCFGEKKKTAVVEWLMKNNLASQDVCFYSDSYTDLPLLEHCKEPVAVNPDRILARAAKERGWRILRFKSVLG
ncbi:MAG: HAD-IB family hydrolase [Treponema sp.]|jgi:HAD superfamily hydrolase (TIGR01490 family)|nr:HAD-IB family hydrolase [Treponema sp.]